MSEGENPIGDIRYAFIYEGPVVARNDPMRLGRVKVKIPGLCEPSTGWAFPVGTANGGTAQRGAKYVPPLGAEVAVFFKGGDPDQPRYIAGHWGVPDGKSELPEDARDLPAGQSEDVHCHEFARYKIKVDERAGQPGSFSITDKVSGDSVEFDGSGPGILIKGSAAVVIQSDGLIVLDATRVVIKDRTVSDGPQPI